MKKLLFVLFAWLIAIQCAFAAININSAPETDLDKLPGIGPVKAKAIVEERKKNGPFKSIEDLKRVKGIGDATLKKLKSEITVDGAPKAEAKPAGKKGEKK
ncbi:MAG: ComEA family DNA-binding protein [Betaproteobacteria bacterium]|nr:ComEA family DNA-binding protein [Betaproteobacteria bacterium]